LGDESVEMSFVIAPDAIWSLDQDGLLIAYDLHDDEDIEPRGIIVEGERLNIKSDVFDLLGCHGFAFSRSFDAIGIGGYNDALSIHHDARRTRNPQTNEALRYSVECGEGNRSGL
jgi:hypothetical protein